MGAQRVRIDYARLVKSGTRTLGAGAVQLLAAEPQKSPVIGVLVQPASDAGTVYIGDAAAQNIALPADGLYLAIADPWQLYVRGTQNKQVHYLLLS